MKKSIYVFFIITVIIVSLMGCLAKKTIKIGYVGGLTGRFSDIGISGKNGVILAIEEANAADKLKGNLIELIAKDDQNNAEAAITADRELVNEGAKVIIGHMTSSASVAAMPFINSPEAKGILMISPTTRTSKLTGIDDQFFSVIPPMKAATNTQAEYMNKIGIKKMVILYDLANRDFSEDWASNFSSDYTKRGGEIIGIRQFTSGTVFSYLEIMKEIASLHPEGILIIAGGVDAAMFCQQIPKVGLKSKILSSSWAMTNDFLENGGLTVEGVIFSNPVNPENKYIKYDEFVKKYYLRFGKKPDFAAAYGYEAAQVSIEGLYNNSNNVKEALLHKKSFEGLWGTYRLDEFGDAQRSNFILSVQNGKFRAVDDYE